jgi:DNA-binding LytR/AlgR family response regulator
MNIAICDDDLEILNRLREQTFNMFQALKEDVKICTFTSGVSLIGSIEEDCKDYNVILLDIDMPGISGLDVAKKLRDKNDDVIIIFVSSHEKYVFDSIEYRPFRYIRKNRIK